MTELGDAASSSSSSFTFGWTYHVFLSFRGEDTRYGFTGNLYYALRERGIRTFIDDRGIRKGEEITPTLVKKIEESKTAIVVFSKDYASSTFCLTELVHILDCMKGHNDRFIWPVFYDIDPSDIRHQTGSYKVAFDQYEGVKDETTVKRWRSALTEAASISGSHFDPRSKSYEYEIIEKIIEAVSKEISIGPLHIAQFPVGLESRVEEVCSLLNKQPHRAGATMVGIFGLGGIGKTTIARALYNEIASNFKHICFLNNVKEKSIHDLQKRLLSETVREKDIELEDYRCGISIIKDRLHNKKIFLILDDIDTLEQLKALAGEPQWFGSGSIIIITTRDKNLLEKHEVDRIYEAKELNDEEAHDLLIGNAFRKEAADPKYNEVIIRIIEYAGGLPLALEILGSNLGGGQTVKEWKTYLDIYEKIPNKTVQKILKVSYDGLEETHKEIFLDIACFYRDCRLGDVTNILSGSHSIDSESCIRVLKDKSLIKIDQDGYFYMHDLIQDMGKEIVRQESPFEAGERSRLWSKEDILHVLNENTGTARIQAMNLWFHFHDKVVKCSGEGFEKMKNLKVLRVLSCFEGLTFFQDPKCLPNSLRVVEWNYYPSSTFPDDFCPINLVILQLTNSRLKTLGKAFKNFNNLHQLNLSFSKDLEELPDISEAVNLEVLEVSYCSKLTKIDDSVGRLAKLKVLNAEGCISLDTFIVKGMELVSLEVLNLSYCFKLHTFPKILVPMKKIKIFDMSHTAIKTLPESIEKLDALERLSSNYYGFDPPDLKTLYLANCIQLQEIRKIPPNIKIFSVKNFKSLTSSFIRALLKHNLFNLIKLNLQGSENLEELPDISKAVNLEELDISFCKKLTKIDDSVGRLGKLRVLNASRCKRLDTFIVGGIKMISIEILNLKECSNLHTFPEILENIKGIKTLDLSHTAIKTLPKSIEKLTTLEALYLNSCKELRQLPNLACHNLKTLILDGCKDLEEIKGIPPNIDVFFARNCTSLTFRSARLLLTQELQETRKTEFILPGNEIPKWLHKHSTGGSVSFWVRRKLPQIALYAIVTGGPTIFSYFPMQINGVTQYVVSHVKIEIEIDHIFLFDLRKGRNYRFDFRSESLAKEWNHAKFSLEGRGTESRLKYIGVYVYNYDSCMEDILFENPIPQERIQVEAVHKIGDSNLESSRRDNNEEDDKLNKEIMHLSTKTISNIEKKKAQLKVDKVNLTLSLPFPEPSSDTTSYHDLQQQQHQHLNSINQQIPESSAIIKKVKGKDIIVYEGNTNEKKGRNTLEGQLQEIVHTQTQEKSFILPRMKA